MSTSESPDKFGSTGEPILDLLHVIVEDGNDALALRTLDAYSKMPETDVAGKHYEALAVELAGHGRPDGALMIAMDEDRLLLGPVPRTEDESLEGIDDRSLKSAVWLCRASFIYEATKRSGVTADPILVQEFLSKVDDTIRIFTEESQGTASTMHKILGEASLRLMVSGEADRAEALKATAPTVREYVDSNYYFRG